MPALKPPPRNVTAIALPGLVNPHDLSDDRQFSMNLARGLEVLRAFTATSPVIGNREISDRTGLPKPTVSRITYTLLLMGYLTRDPLHQKFRLGPSVLSLSHPLLASMQIRQPAKPLMESLARKTGCTVNLGLRDRTNAVYVDSVRADKLNQHLPDIGSSYPLLASAIGRALILASPAKERIAVLNYLKVHDRNTFDTYRASMERNRKLLEAEGYCESFGEWQKELHAVAVPIATPAGNPALAMNCTLYAHRAEAGKLVDEVVPLLKDAVRRLEAAQGIR
jgi:DNA-binding IclR family transcriptional regulator